MKINDLELLLYITQPRLVNEIATYFRCHKRTVYRSLARVNDAHELCKIIGADGWRYQVKVKVPYAANTAVLALLTLEELAEFLNTRGASFEAALVARVCAEAKREWPQAQHQKFARVRAKLAATGLNSALSMPTKADLGMAKLAVLADQPVHIRLMSSQETIVKKLQRYNAERDAFELADGRLLHLADVQSIATHALLDSLS